MAQQKTFNDIIREKDEEWANMGMTGDAHDLCEELIDEHGEQNRGLIKKSVNNFYDLA